MFEIVYDPWDGEALSDERAFMYGLELVRDIVNHDKNEIVTRTIASFHAIDSVRLMVKQRKLRYNYDVTVVWNNEIVKIDANGRIDYWPKYFGDVFDILLENIFDL